MDEFLPGWTVAREIPPDVVDGVNRGVYQVHGGVIRMAPGAAGAGRIVRHLIPARQDPNVPFGGFLNLPLASTEHLLQMATGAMVLSSLNLAVSAVGFAVLYKKLTDLDKSLTAMAKKVEGIARLLELEEKAKLASALKTLSMVMKGGALDSRKQQLLNERLLNAVLNVFGPVNMKYRELLPAAESETAMACQGYFALTSLATAACHAELGMARMAKDYLDDDCAFWAQQARRIAGDLLGEHPERFVAGEFVSEVSLREVAAWRNFAADEDRSEPERIDELRNRIRLSTNKGGGLIAIPLLGKDDPAAVAKTIEADKQGTIPALRELVARHGVFRGYADQYALLDENGMTPSEFQRRVDALDREMLVDGYVILEPTQADLETRPTR
ncbi:MAG: hypothetical protein OXU75_16070 [Deltaproteobacteria bacterium]|nr:hypothetical protein [Deltaproteobacteria bacterium]